MTPRPGAPRLTIFLDDGGVMNDNARRGPQWRRLLAERFAPRFGGAPEAWGEANRVVATRLFEEHAQQWRGRVDVSYAAVCRAYRLEWLQRMFEAVGVPVPPEDEAVRLAQEAEDFVTPRVRAAFPGAAEAIRELHRQKYRLCTASGESSASLDGYVRGMGVRDGFERLYGPDLVDTLKEGTAYCQRIFADAAVTPRQALVVDDSRVAVAWAAEAGARTVLVGAADGAGLARPPDRVVASLAELPRAIAELGELLEGHA